MFLVMMTNLMMKGPHIKWPEDVLNTFLQNYEETVYKIVETARQSGKIKKGTNETTKAVDRNQAKLVIIAINVDPPEIVMHLPALCEEKGIPYVYVSSKERLGEAAGIKTSAASACIIEPGEAKAQMDQLINSLKQLLKK